MGSPLMPSRPQKSASPQVLGVVYSHQRMVTSPMDTNTPDPGSRSVFLLSEIFTISFLSRKVSAAFLMTVHTAIWCRAPVKAEYGSIRLPPLAQFGSELYLHACVHTRALHMNSLWIQRLKSWPLFSKPSQKNQSINLSTWQIKM